MKTIYNGIVGNPDQDYIEVYKSHKEFHDFCDYFERFIDRIEWDGVNGEMLRESMKNLLENGIWIKEYLITKRKTLRKLSRNVSIMLGIIRIKSFI